MDDRKLHDAMQEIDRLRDQLELQQDEFHTQQNESDRAQFNLAQQVDRIDTRTKIGVYKRDVIEEIIGNHTNQIIGAWFRKNLWVMIGTIITVLISLFTPLGTMMYYKSNLDTAAVDIKELKEVRIEHTTEIERIRANLQTDVATLKEMVKATQNESGRDKTELLGQIRQINDRLNNLDLVIRGVKRSGE